MALDKVTVGVLADNAVTSAKIADGTVVAADIAANSVDSSELVDGAVDLSHMSVNSIDSDQYVDASIDTAHIADNQITLAKMAGGTDGNIITYDTSGDPAYVATGTSGHVLTSAGADAVPAFAAIPASGITHATEFRLETSFTGTDAVVTGTWDSSNTNVGIIGSAVTESSGQFTLPATGIWFIAVQCFMINSNSPQDTTVNCRIRSGTTVISEITQGGAQGYGQASALYGHFLYDCTSTGTTLNLYTESISGSSEIRGSASENKTSIMFIRLGDT